MNEMIIEVLGKGILAIVLLLGIVNVNLLLINEFHALKHNVIRMVIFCFVTCISLFGIYAVIRIAYSM